MAQIRDLMTQNPTTCEPSATAADVAKVMRDEDVGPVPIVEGDQLVGIVAQADVARAADEERTGEVVQDISQ